MKRILTRPSDFTSDEVEAHVRKHPADAAVILAAEYLQPRPRFALIRWLKRHGANPVTTRTVKR